MPKTPATFWTYVLQNPAGKFYIGSTDSLQRRLAEHNSPEKDSSKFTHKNGPWRLAWSEEHATRSEAVRQLLNKQVLSPYNLAGLLNTSLAKTTRSDFN